MLQVTKVNKTSRPIHNLKLNLRHNLKVATTQTSHSLNHTLERSTQTKIKKRHKEIDMDQLFN